MSVVPKTIVLQGGGGKYEEGILTGILKPGNLVALGDATLALAGDASPTLIVATEDALQGKTIADAYAVGDKCFYYRPVSNDVLYVRAANATYANGASLQAVALGRLGAVAAGPHVATAEATDPETDGDQVVAVADDFLRVRVA